MSYESEIVYDNTKTLDPRIKDRLKYDDKGLVCAVIQQYDTHEVLMVGYMDDEALRRTLTAAGILVQRRHVRSCAVCEGSQPGLRRRRHSRGS